MGGLIALYALQKRPELFKGIVFCGTPFGPVPLILWGIQKGAPIARACSPEMHFAARSSFLFLPIDGKALVDFKDEDILIDYFKPQEWVDYKLFKRKLSENEQKAQMDHLSNALKKARDLHDTIRRFPVTTHPFVVVTSDRWPTPSRLKCSVKREGLRIMHPCHFVPGDGVVSYENAQMPLGYTFDTICSRSSHPSLMNDLKAMTLALKKIHSPSSSS